VIENVFALPGLGSLLLTGIFNRDFQIVQSATLVYAVIVVTINLLTDLAYGLLDPRVVLGE
jgi:peptide/nickel transport system permease protein